MEEDWAGGLRTALHEREKPHWVEPVPVEDGRAAGAGMGPGRKIGIAKRRGVDWGYGAGVGGEVPDGQESLNAFENC